MKGGDGVASRRVGHARVAVRGALSALAVSAVPDFGQAVRGGTGRSRHIASTTRIAKRLEESVANVVSVCMCALSMVDPCL